jgi:hypothetical protein
MDHLLAFPDHKGAIRFENRSSILKQPGFRCHQGHRGFSAIKALLYHLAGAAGYCRGRPDGEPCAPVGKRAAATRPAFYRLRTQWSP